MSTVTHFMQKTGWLCWLVVGGQGVIVVVNCLFVLNTMLSFLCSKKNENCYLFIACTGISFFCYVSQLLPHFLVFHGWLLFVFSFCCPSQWLLFTISFFLMLSHTIAVISYYFCCHLLHSLSTDISLFLLFFHCWLLSFHLAVIWKMKFWNICFFTKKCACLHLVFCFSVQCIM